jgi:hypothetical protein
MKYAQLGSVSHGTMRIEDLLATFASELEYQLKRQPKSFKRAGFRKLINEARRVGPETERAQFVLDALFDALDEFSPPYGYFGALEGDGADYGFWLSHGVAEEFDGLKVADTGDVPRSYRGEVLHINDHGNMTLYVATSRGLREIWGVV